MFNIPSMGTVISRKYRREEREFLASSETQSVSYAVQCILLPWGLSSLPPVSVWPCKPGQVDLRTITSVPPTWHCQGSHQLLWEAQKTHWFVETHSTIHTD